MTCRLERAAQVGIASEAILWARTTGVRLRARGRDAGVRGAFGEPKGVTEIGGTLYVAGETGLFRVQVDSADSLAVDGRGFTRIALACDGLYAAGWYEPILVRYSP